VKIFRAHPIRYTGTLPVYKLPVQFEAETFSKSLNLCDDSIGLENPNYARLYTCLGSTDLDSSDALTIPIHDDCYKSSAYALSLLLTIINIILIISIHTFHLPASLNFLIVNNTQVYSKKS
jgi:hypothetical protein